MKKVGSREAKRDAVPDGSSFSLWPHRIALLLACATFPLLFIGGLVTSKGAGLAVPDWPTTFGYNMFLYPWSKMVGNIFYEHSHRLVASFVGLLTIVLVVIFWLREPRKALRGLALAALALVIFQGVLGGLRVVLLEHVLAIFHAATAQLFFAVTVALAVLTSAEWHGAPPEPSLDDGGRLARLCAATSGLIYLQIVFGAVLRHTGEYVEAHWIFAALVALHVMLIALRLSKQPVAMPRLSRLTRWLFGLLLLQLPLGTVSYLAKFTSVGRLSSDGVVALTTVHLAVGALMLVTAVALTLKAYLLTAHSTDRRRDRRPLAEQVTV